VAEKATDEEYKSLAHLRLSALQLDKKAYDEALKQLEGVKSPEFAALADDRRGDILLASGKQEDAAKAYLAAYKAMDDKLDYRRVVEAKLASLGAAPEPAVAASGVAK
jgi:predicted negative regulator of RcsB-dependent stress response